MEEINKMIKIIERCSKAFLELDVKKTDIRNKECEVLDKVFNKLKPILRFIDQKVIIYDSEYFNGNSWQGQRKYFREKVLILKETNNDYSEEKFYWTRKGTLFLLTRELRILRFDREGHYSQYQNSAEKTKYTNETEIKIEELLKETKFELLIKEIKGAFEFVIEKNKNKKPILAERLRLIECIEDQLKN